MTRFHEEVWAMVFENFRQRQPGESVAALIGVLEAQLGRGEFDPSKPETRGAIEAILGAVMPDRLNPATAGKED
jgi:hypothetical protein